MINSIETTTWLIKSASALRRLTGNQVGIGLVETLVAVASLGVTAVTFLTSLSAGTVSVNTLEQQVVAQGLARTEMETIKAAAYDVTGLSYPSVAVPEGYAVSINTASNIGTDADIQKIVVAVAFQDQPVSRLEGYKVKR